ncbi:ribosomal protein S8e-domain-containing protein [Mycena sanguinolenta]|nr:ribosomal protein S8e-domain-containing protein [Mycena sanguinolenta]
MENVRWFGDGRSWNREQAYYHKKKDNLSWVASLRTPSWRKHIHTVCICDGSIKYRALCLDSSDFSEVVTRKTSLIRYVYNASNNELVRTNTLVKSTIIQVDAMLFRQWYETHYAQPITKKGKAQTPGAATSTAAPTEPVRLSKHAQPNLDEKKKKATIDLLLETQFAAGCLYASISKWLGQSGRADGHILEGKELEGKLRTGKQKHAGLIHLSV